MALLIFAEAVAAGHCYAPNNEGAWIRFNPGSTRGIKGEADMVVASPLSQSTAIVHPRQAVTVDYSGDPDFVGWGTKKGVGTSVPGAISNCPGNFGSDWWVYIDGLKFDKYFCNAPYYYVPNGAQNQYFRIEYTTCPGDGFKKWVFYWNSIWKSCVTVDDDHGTVYAGAESVGTTSAQNLAISYLALRYKDDSGNWLSPSISGTCVSNDYGLTIYSSTAFDVYVQP